MIVRVTQMGRDEKQHVELPEGATVQDALTKAGISSTGITVTINGSTAQLDAKLSHKQTVMVASKVAGGNA